MVAIALPTLSDVDSPGPVYLQLTGRGSPVIGC